MKTQRIPWNKGKVGVQVSTRRNGLDKTCAHCGAAFYVPLNKADARFCNSACYFASRWGDSRQETRACVVCGAEFTAFKAHRKITCNDACRQKRKGDNNSGERSAFWRGGSTTPYDRSWREIRLAALDRDGHACTICQSVDRLQVHHVNPYRYSKDHSLGNLVTLCRKCHSREELKVNPAAADGLQSRWQP